ncbi:MAG: DUF3096 domain-containing protein [Gammaproteobacteria bacterium]
MSAGLLPRHDLHFVARLLNYIVAIYLIIIGLFGAGNFSFR